MTLTLPATATGLAVAARAGGRGVPVAVPAGQASFGSAPGAVATVAIALPATVQRLLAQRHRLTLTATIETGGGSGQSFRESAHVLVKAPAKPRKPRHKRKR